MADLGYEGAIRWLYHLSERERSGMRLGLKSIRGLCRRMGDPQRDFRSIHIAGSNGKGSVAHMVDAVLGSAGVRTGMYTSPHLQTFRERIRVGGEMIERDVMVAIAGELFPHVEAMDFEPTFFDVTTALALIQFRDEAVDRGVVEVGLGGRLDSTNVLENVDVCVVTNISMEHADILGPDLVSIAREKASIAKPGSRVVVGEAGPEALAEIEKVAMERGAREICSVTGHEVLESDLEGMRVRVTGDLGTYDLDLDVVGRHQASNAALAVSALEALPDPPGRAVVERGLKGMVVPGRMERMNGAPTVLIDGAHNPAAARALATAVEDIIEDRRLVLLLGLMEDKDVEGFLEPLLPLCDAVVSTKAGSPRALDPDRITRGIGDRESDVGTSENVEEGLGTAMDLAGSDGVVLATGSIYMIGEVRQVFLPVDDPL